MLHLGILRNAITYTIAYKYHVDLTFNDGYWEPQTKFPNLALGLMVPFANFRQNTFYLPRRS